MSSMAVTLQQRAHRLCPGQTDGDPQAEGTITDVVGRPTPHHQLVTDHLLTVARFRDAGLSNDYSTPRWPPAAPSEIQDRR